MQAHWLLTFLHNGTFVAVQGKGILLRTFSTQFPSSRIEASRGKADCRYPERSPYVDRDPKGLQGLRFSVALGPKQRTREADYNDDKREQAILWSRNTVAG